MKLSSAQRIKEWLNEQGFSKNDMQELMDNISTCIEKFGEFKEDMQSFIYNLLVHGNERGTSLNVVIERSKGINEERIYTIAKFLNEEEIIDDVGMYDLDEQVMDLENDISYKIQKGVWVLKGQYRSLYRLMEFLEDVNSRKDAKKDLKKSL